VRPGAAAHVALAGALGVKAGLARGALCAAGGRWSGGPAGGRGGLPARRRSHGRKDWRGHLRRDRVRSIRQPQHRDVDLRKGGRSQARQGAGAQPKGRQARVGLRAAAPARSARALDCRASRLPPAARTSRSSSPCPAARSAHLPLIQPLPSRPCCDLIRQQRAGHRRALQRGSRGVAQGSTMPAGAWGGPSSAASSHRRTCQLMSAARKERKRYSRAVSCGSAARPCSVHAGGAHESVAARVRMSCELHVRDTRQPSAARGLPASGPTGRTTRTRPASPAGLTCRCRTAAGGQRTFSIGVSGCLTFNTYLQWTVCLSLRTWHIGIVQGSATLQKRPWPQSMRDWQACPTLQLQLSGHEPYTSGKRQQRQQEEQLPGWVVLRPGRRQNLCTQSSVVRKAQELPRPGPVWASTRGDTAKMLLLTYWFSPH
jgi:hypothetical protein